METISFKQDELQLWVRRDTAARWKRMVIKKSVFWNGSPFLSSCVGVQQGFCIGGILFKKSQRNNQGTWTNVTLSAIVTPAALLTLFLNRRFAFKNPNIGVFPFHRQSRRCVSTAITHLPPNNDLYSSLNDDLCVFVFALVWEGSTSLHTPGFHSCANVHLGPASKQVWPGWLC